MVDGADRDRGRSVFCMKGIFEAATRLLSKEEFGSELELPGLEPMETHTKTGRLWKTRDGSFISVPETEDQTRFLSRFCAKSINCVCCEIERPSTIYRSCETLRNVAFARRLRSGERRLFRPARSGRAPGFGGAPASQASSTMIALRRKHARLVGRGRNRPGGERGADGREQIFLGRRPATQYM